MAEPTDEQTKKPRIRFCWHCGRQLRGNHFIEKELFGHKRILHKSCLKDAKIEVNERPHIRTDWEPLDD